MNLKNLLFLILTACLFSSCVSQGKMLKLMHSGTSLPPAPQYGALDGSRVTTFVEASEIQGIQQWPQVRQQNYRFIPLLFFNNWKSAYNCQIGVRDVEQNLKPNFETALTRKFRNSEILQQKLRPDSLNYTLDVWVDTLKSNIPFVSKGTIIFALVAYTSILREGVEDADLVLTTSFRLSENGRVLKEGFVKTKRIIPAAPDNRTTKKRYMHDYLTHYFSELNVLLEHNATEIISRLETSS